MKKLISFLHLLMWVTMGVNTHGQSGNTNNYGSFEIIKVAQTPPLGWNSWDVFGADVSEDEVKAMADYMSEHLKPFGYEYVVIDIAWYAPNASAIEKRYQQPNPHQLIDEFGRLIPDPGRFPSAVKGGFKPLADYVHSKGLKLGIHIMRGIPKQAVWKNTPIKGTSYRARDIVMYEKACTFYDGMFSIDMSKAGSQEYYNSIVDLYAEWGVDFIKADDMTSYPHKLDEVKALRYAIECNERPIVLSLSPGAVNSWHRSFLQHYADMYRISGDFWDEWEDLKAIFAKARTFKGHTGPGAWADCDMIPLGKINVRAENGIGARMSRFTPDEYRTLMSFWTIYRSPLMLGMDLSQMDQFTYSVITNESALEINQTSVKNREVAFARESYSIWTAQSVDGKAHYLAMFNLEDHPQELATTLEALGIEQASTITDIWTGDTDVFEDNEIRFSIEPHGVKYAIVK